MCALRIATAEYLATITVGVDAGIHSVHHTGSVGAMRALRGAATEGFTTIAVGVDARIELIGGVGFVGTSSIWGGASGEMTACGVVVFITRSHAPVGAALPAVLSALERIVPTALRDDTGVGCVGRASGMGSVSALRSRRVMGSAVGPGVWVEGILDLVDDGRHFGGSVNGLLQVR